MYLQQMWLSGRLLVAVIPQLIAIHRFKLNSLSTLP
jgi:hypothetical protein